MDKHATICVLTDAYSEYQRELLERIVERLKHEGYGVLCVAGRALDIQRGDMASYGHPGNAIYHQARGYPVKGYIALTGTLSHESAGPVLNRFVELFSHLPLVSLGAEIPGVSSFLVENTIGMIELMQHMTSDHSRQKFAFVRGFTNSPDSVEREAAFRAVLREKGIGIDENLIIKGNFQTADAYEALHQLLDTTHDIDAIVCANDLMAVSAIRALSRHGLNVPEDVIVCGFDGSNVTAETSPPVTTVKAPIEELITRSIDDLITQISLHGESQVPLSAEHLAGQVIIRASSSPVLDTCSGESRLSQNEFIRSLGMALERTSAFDAIDLEQLLITLDKTLRDGTPEYLNYIESRLKHTELDITELHWWRNFVLQFNLYFSRIDQKCINPEAVASITSAFSLIYESVWSVQADRFFDLEKTKQIQDRMQLMLASCRTMPEIAEVLDHVFEHLGIQRAFTVQYIEPGVDIDNQARLLHCFGCSSDNTDCGEEFPTNDVLPIAMQAQLCQGLLIQSPLVSGDSHFGYLMIDPSGLEYLDLTGMVRSISTTMRNCHQIQNMQNHATALQSANTELVKIANFDVLTGLPNRVQFQSNLRHSFIDAEYTDTMVALLFFDLDGFKRINDTLGHAAGDRLLKIVAKRLGKVLGESGSIARLGGDEFTAIVPGVRGAATSAKIAEKILDTLRNPYTLGTHVVSLSASIGIAHYPDDGQDVDTLVKHADTAMYYAKSIGKNCFHFYTQNLNDQAVAQLQLDQDMRAGLVNREFTMHFQPRYEITGQRLVAFEALMRWTPPTNEEGEGEQRVGPDVFVPLAEQTGFIIELGFFALEQSCKQAKEWDLSGMPVVVSVNISVVQLQQDNIVDQVLASIQHYDLDPALLELEITETAAMTDVQSNIEKLTKLRSQGIKISIDDFGTGYSSLNYLKKLPVSALKIDKSFLAEVNNTNGHQSADAAIVRAVVALGKSMEFRLIAEGIETEQQLDFVEQLGCDEIQGFLFGRPVSAGEATEMLRSSREQNKAA